MSVVMALLREPNATVSQKTLAVSDHYFGFDDWEFPLGLTQMCATSHGEQIRGEAPLPALMAHMPEWPFDKMAEHSIDFWLQSEDLPRPENGIFYNSDRVTLDIRCPDACSSVLHAVASGALVLHEHSRSVSRLETRASPRCSVSSELQTKRPHAYQLPRVTRAVLVARVVRPCPTRRGRRVRAASSSDHMQSWSPSQGHAGFTWSWFGAALQATKRLTFGAITVPGGWRYHPVVLAQAIATLGEMFSGRLP